MQEGARKQGGRGTDMEGKGHDPRVWPYGRDVNATKKSRLGRYEHRFLIRVTDTLLQAAHRTTDYMYIDTGVENSSLYRAATAGLAAKL